MENQLLELPWGGAVLEIEDVVASSNMACMAAVGNHLAANGNPACLGASLKLNIASGLLGADGQNVLSLVGEDLKRKGGLKPQLPNMVEENVVAVAIEQGHVKHNIVQVK